MSFLKNYSSFIIIFLSVICYTYVAYFLDRTNFNLLITIWIILFGGVYILLKNNHISFASFVLIAFLFRLIFLFLTPNLSQDFYRFIWDGRMLFNGYNPYLSLPESFIKQGIFPIPESIVLYEGMGTLNGSHYTNYPPLNQFCFFIAALFSEKSIFGAIIVLRSITILADIGILYFGKKLLEKLQLPTKNIFWYILNPFVIIEMTGNLHFESVMLFFLVAALYKLYQKKWISAAILFSFSISIKLIPLLFLPLFFNVFIKKKTFKKANNYYKLATFYTIIVISNIILFVPFYHQNLISNYTNSVGLWFKNFEFNASFYYIFREVGYLFRGYNEIAIIGKITPILTIIFLIYLTFFKVKKHYISLLTAMLFGISFYYFTSTTVHPWYIATPLILSIFTRYKFPVFWSFLIILSYQAYANLPWKENIWIVLTEYVLLFSFLFYEINKNRHAKESIK